LLDLDLAIEPQEAVAGGAAPVVVKLRNAGTVAEQVEDPTKGSPYTYDVVSKNDGTLRQIGATIYFRRSRPSPMPLPPPELTTLAAGAVLDYGEDLSAWALEPLPPGEYEVTAVYVHGGRVYRSPGRALRVLLPRFQMSAATASRTRARLGEVTLQAAGSRAIVAQRESAKPGTGTWLERARASGAVGGLAIASEVEEDSRDRWIAWLEGGAFRAGIWQDENEIRTIGPVLLGLESPRLVASGWQYADARALFAAVGTVGGRAVVKFVSVAVEGDPHVYQDELAGAPPRRLAATFVREGSRDSIYLCWAEEQSGSTKIYARKYVPARPVKNPAVLVAQTTESLAALALPAVVSESPAVLHALFGPAAGRKMTYSQVPLAKGGKRQDWSFTAPAAREAPGPWSIDSGPGRTHVVVAQVGDRLMFTAAERGDGWRVLAEGVAAGSAPDVVPLSEPWVVWTDPALGLRYQRLPR
jgi:hypothetical protein